MTWHDVYWMVVSCIAVVAAVSVERWQMRRIGAVMDRVEFCTLHKETSNVDLLRWVRDYIGVPDAKIKSFTIKCDCDWTSVEVVRYPKLKEVGDE